MVDKMALNHYNASFDACPVRSEGGPYYPQSRSYKAFEYCSNMHIPSTYLQIENFIKYIQLLTKI